MAASVDELIARADERAKPACVPAEVVEGLRKMIEYNRSGRGYVKQREALRWCRENGWRGQAERFNELLLANFGESSWATVCRPGGGDG